jgi:hypothetical protein
VILTHNGTESSSAVHLHQAILETFVYADIFDYPLAAPEVVRYVSAPASDEDVLRFLERSAADGQLVRVNEYFALPDRETIISLRERREAIARQKWPATRRYVRWLALVPYVRMVGVTGTLAVNNVEDEDDIDVFIVTEAGRLWLCRALVIAIVRLARLAGDELCPNYFVSTRQLIFPDRSFFGAREIAQMVPLYGGKTYDEVRQRNRWVEEFLPQASDMPNPAHHIGSDGDSFVTLGTGERGLKQVMEWLLSGRVGTALERWEMARKTRKFTEEARVRGGSVFFSADVCKGHFDHHDRTIIERYQQRLSETGLGPDRERKI